MQAEKKTGKNKGFTFIELVFVLALLVILIGITAPNYVRYLEKAQMSADASNLSDLATAVTVATVDEEFDVIVSRNLTWTLPDAEHAYQEWFRVLKPGGVMINLDANYGAADFADTADLPENHAHHQIQDELMQECEDIKRQLPISSFLRPAWDLETLSRIGVEEFSFDLGISKRIYTEKDEFYNPTPMFLIFAKKQR